MTEQLLVNGKTEDQKKDYSKCYLSLAVILFFCLLALGGFTYYYIFLKKGDEVCVNEECLKTSLEIVTSIDDSINPCDSFPDFVCGSFSKKHQLYFASKDSIREERINTLITEDATGDESESLILQKQFYLYCLDEESIDVDFNNNILDVIGELGGWPILTGQWDNSRFNLTNFFITCAELGLPFEWFFKISYGPSPDDEETSVIHISKPDGISDRVDYVKDAAYLELILETAAQLGGSKIKARNEAKWIIEMEYLLHRIWKDYDSSENQPVTLNNLLGLFPHADIPYLIQNITGDYLIPANDSVVSTNSTILKDINRLLAGNSEWTQVNFLIWKIIQSRGAFLSSPLREKFGNLENFFGEGYSDLSREGICLTEAKKRFPLVANFAYIKNYLDDTKVDKINEMITNIKSHFVRHIENAEWIANETKPIIIDKINNLKTNIKVYEHQQDILHGLLDIMASEVNFTTESIYDLLTETSKYNFKVRFTFMNQTSVDPTEYGENFEDGFGYNDETNEIVLPARVLDDYLYVEDRPSYINYGLLGTLITREMSRALHPDALAGIEEAPDLFLWKNDTETDASLFVRSRCIVDQYVKSGYTDHSDDIFSENYINLMKLDVAYESYVMDSNNDLIMLPHLEGYHPDQLFWMIYEMQFCSQEDTENPVSATYRALNPIQNSRYFGEVFECPEDSIMVHKEKCILF